MNLSDKKKIDKKILCGIIILMKENNNLTQSEKLQNRKKMAQKAELLERYFLVCFLYRDVQKCTGNDYIIPKPYIVGRQGISPFYNTGKEPFPKTKPVSSLEESESEVFKILKKYINDDCTEFDIIRFVKEEKNYFNLLPDEIRDVDEVRLSSMAEDAKKNNKYVSFVKICLEELFDSKFRYEFNKKTDDFLIKEERRCKNEKLKDFDKVDIVNDFLGLFSKSYSFLDNGKFDDEIERDTPKWKFNDYGKEIGQRKNRDKVERLDNLYSGFKLYGHGEYTKLLIAYRQEVENNHVFGLVELRERGIKPVIEDAKYINGITFKIYIDGKLKECKASIKDIFKEKYGYDTKAKLGKFYVNDKSGKYTIQTAKLSKAVNVIKNIEKFLHSRFNNDYTPKELDGKYNKNQPQKTLREEIISLCLRKTNSDNDDVRNPFDEDDCGNIRNLFVKIIKEYNETEWNDILDRYGLLPSYSGLSNFKNHDFNDIQSIDYLRKHKIRIIWLYQALCIFKDQGRLKDDRSGEELQSFQKLENKFNINNPIRGDKPIKDKDGKETDFTLFDTIPGRNENSSDIIQSTSVFDLLMRRIEEAFGESIDFENFMKRYLNIWNEMNKHLLFFNKGNTDNTSVVYRVVKKVIGKEKVKIIEEAINKVKDCKVYLSRYENVVNNDFAVISLQNVFNTDDETIEKIWMAISLESLKNKEDHPWRELVNVYKSRECIYSDDELKYMEKYVKQSMQMIYAEILKFKEKKDDKKRDV